MRSEDTRQHQPKRDLATDYEAIAARYDEARTQPLEALSEWRDALQCYFDTGGERVIDVGAGTGLWASALTTWFKAAVVGVEPSQSMRTEAQHKRNHADIAYVGGRAEQLPLKKTSCSCAWVSTVVHHISDLSAAARELRRVLLPGSPVLIRNAFAGRTEGIPWLDYFPSAKPLAERRWGTVSDVTTAFETAGFKLEALQRVAEVTDASLSAYADRIRVRTDSTLAALDDRDFARGLGALERAASSELTPHPVVTTLDLLVLA